MATQFIVIALSLLCALCAAAGNAFAQRAGPGVLPPACAPGNDIVGVTQDDVHKLWTWLGPEGDTDGRQQAAIPIRYFAYDPYAVDAGTAEPVQLNVYAESSVTDLWVELQAGSTVTPTEIGADAYQFTFPAVDALYGYDPLYFRSFVGYLYIDTAFGPAGRLNLFIDVINEEVPGVVPTTLAPDAQAAGHAVNLLAPSATPGSYDHALVQRLYGLYDDAFDFLNVVWVDNRVQNRMHATISNGVQGIGRILFDNTASYGSAGRLQGINNFPISGFFDGASIGFQHETGHQWIQWVLPGIPHWPVSEMAQGIMGYNIPGSGGVGGQFPWRFTPNGDGTYTVHNYGEHRWEVGFCDLDLYLMGILATHEISPALVFENQDQQLCHGCVLEGPSYYADANAIVASHGPRVPDASTAAHDFTVGTIVVTRDRLLTPEELAFYDFMAARASATEAVHTSEGFVARLTKPWFLNTRTLSTLVTDMVPLGEVPTPTPTATPTEPASLPAPRLYSIVNDDGDGSYLVDWSAVNGATLYVLQEDDNDRFRRPTEVYHGGNTLTSLEGRAPGTYYYRVKASDDLQESGWSNVRSVIVTQGTPTPTASPTPTLTQTGTATATATASATPTATAIETPQLVWRVFLPVIHTAR